MSARVVADPGTVTFLSLRWSTSRGRETYGWNVLTLTDVVAGRRYRCNGGGYDMHGTVLAEWACGEHADRLRPLAPVAHTVWRALQPGPEHPEGDTLYGLSAVYRETGVLQGVAIDGACGVRSVELILAAAGIGVRPTYDPGTGRLTGWVATVGGVL